MTTDQKNKYEEAIKSITPTIEIIEQAHSEGWNDAIDSVISVIKVGPEQVYIHSGKIYDELQKLRK